MDKNSIKGEVKNAVKSAKRHVEEWTDETKAKVEDVAHKAKDKAEHALDTLGRAISENEDD